ncbi:hypothetical protein VCRA2119O147_130084 [Vibrio crassostreae]|nr:hypothetical protein VCRA2113O322_10340 [Vibrio crassostreae]CAK1881022.1 hypothetical protein VCRA2113O326_10339 [Vibrio crassostreae]CAK1957935.1 hypothetical protein VCRA2110O113_20074 [Vibrio crassostreae]CAK1976297.1 hypothetical protein VCRA2113O213_20081 [Vibrio crassostreae]CAK1976629.1 hypothetical protein VCRA2113O196_20078 [Vibrio crassostreae]
MMKQRLRQTQKMTIFIMYNHAISDIHLKCYSITYLQCKWNFSKKSSERLKYNHRLRLV